MSTALAFHTGDEIRVYRDCSLGAVETATVLRLTADGGVRIRFRTDGHEATWRHGRIELTASDSGRHCII
jgi:hypothetical protein